MIRPINISGLSLIEILVVLAILALAVSVVPPMMGGVMDSSMLKHASREVATGLRQVRTAAISKQQQSGFQLDVNTGEYDYLNRSDKLNLPKSTRISFITAESEVESPSSGNIQFFADGSSTGGRIILKSDQQQYSIDVDWLTGRIQITP